MVLGVFAHVDTTVRAIGELRRRGFESLRTYSPLPLTILLGGLCTLLGLLVTAPIPNLGGTVHYDPRFTADRFGVEVNCPPDQVRLVTEVLRGAGAEEVRS